MAQEHEYTFDVKFFASVKVRGATVKDARTSLEAMLQTAMLTMKSSHNQQLPQSVDVEGDRILMEIDGEDVDGMDEEDGE